MPTVSVVIPTYNRLQYLRHAVQSVLEQTMGDLELIVVDDGSTDGTRAHIETVDDSRVRLASRAHCGNVARVRNQGAAMARGRYIAFLDHDDLWLTRKLETQLAAMRDAGVRWSYTQFDHCDEHGQPIATDLPSFWTALSGRIAIGVVNERSMVGLITVLMERELFDELGGFDESPRIAWRDDADLVLRLAMHADTVAVSGVLAYVREHAGRTLRRIDLAEHQLTKAAVYQKALAVARDPALRRALRRRRGIRLAEAGAHRWRTGAWASGAGCFVRSAALRPPLRWWASAALRGFGLKAWPHPAFERSDAHRAETEV